MKKYIPLFLVLIGLFSCSKSVDITKRKYRKGYNITAASKSQGIINVKREKETALVVDGSVNEPVSFYEKPIDKINHSKTKITAPTTVEKKLIKKVETIEEKSLANGSLKREAKNRRQLKKLSKSLMATSGPKDHGGGIASLVFGILAVLTFYAIPFSFIFSLLAIIFGAVSVTKIYRNPGSDSGYGTAGIILGVLAIALWISLIVLIFRLFGV